MIQFFKTLFNLNKIVKEIEAQKIEINLLRNKINNELVKLTNLENKFNEITTK